MPKKGKKSVIDRNVVRTPLTVNKQPLDLDLRLIQKSYVVATLSKDKKFVIRRQKVPAGPFSEELPYKAHGPDAMRTLGIESYLLMVGLLMVKPEGVDIARRLIAFVEREYNFPPTTLTEETGQSKLN